MPACQDLEAYEVRAGLEAMSKGWEEDPKRADEQGEEEEEEAEAKEERCRRDNQCTKNKNCVRGYKHGKGPCRIRMPSTVPCRAPAEEPDDEAEGCPEAVEEESEAARLARCERTNQCAKDARCTRGYRHGGVGGPCKIPKALR